MIVTRRPTSKQSHQGSTTAQKGKQKASSKVRVVVGAAKKVKRHIVLYQAGMAVTTVMAVMATKSPDLLLLMLKAKLKTLKTVGKSTARVLMMNSVSIYN